MYYHFVFKELTEMLLEKSVEAAIIGYVAEEEDVAIVIE